MTTVPGAMVQQQAPVHDVEAYARTTDGPAVLALLATVLGPLTIDSAPGDMPPIYEAEGKVSVILQPSEDGFMSVWILRSERWPSCPALGRFLAIHLRCVVRCDPGPEFPEVSPYSGVFLQIDGDAEGLVTWG